jgi:HK97 family phage prohead protease
MQTKHLSLVQTEFKMGAEGSLKFSGYASVFEGLDSYGDTIKAGAYKNTLTDRERPVQLRWNHSGPVIGKFMELYEDEKGLFVSGELTNGHSVAEDTAALLRHGAISGLSIGYIVKNESQSGVVRELNEIELIEISVVESPADNSAHISSVKSAKTLKEVEQFLHAKGLSQAESKTTISSVRDILGLKKSEDKALSDLKGF